MEKTYNPQDIETKWYQQWENASYFNANNSTPTYCIMLPPPNVTGSLHMGHGFQDSIMDALTRFHRMSGFNTLWQPGTDHAGIATQMVVERKLLAENLSRHDIGREKFVERIWQWKEESGNTITKQLRRLGASLDWPRERFTMDEGISSAVREVFIKLYEEGLIYRGQRLVNWDPELLTAISDLEVNSEETKGELWYIRYPLVSSNDSITVATTRPETMLGDVAVAVHPDDERYQKFIGKRIKLPLTDREIPVIADITVDPAFGTGCVKITPAHDFNDYAMGQRHELPLINIFTPNAKINQNAPEPYQGLDRFVARKKIIADLTALNLLEKTEPHILKIPRGDRSGVVVEPYLTNQWFMKMQPLAEPALKAVKNNEIRFIPENWNKTYFQWLENIEDWCISRQLWWGHRIPAWFDANGNIYVGQDEQDVRAKNNLANELPLTQDTDVLDTWFSSALWPFATLGWPEKTDALKLFYPTSVLVTGFDIIFFWVARMVMLGLKFMGQVPFREVYVTGLIRDHDGHKMSKSKGNVIDPIDIIDGIDVEPLITKRTAGLMQPAMAKKIEQNTRKEFPNGISAYGTDALRFTFCSLASVNREIRFDINKVEGYRNFCNKLWNATRFVLMNIGENKISKSTSISMVDEWILARLQNTINEVHKHFKDYRFDLITQALYEFVWNDYCDWYLEFTKPILNGANETAKQATRYTLVSVLETVLRLIHPLMPFITEEIWQQVAPMLEIKGETIMLQPYPAPSETSHQVAEIEWLKQVILNIRTIRSEMVISPAKLIPLLCYKGTDEDKTRIEKYLPYIKTLAKLESVDWLNADATIPQSSMALVGELQLLIPMAGLIDVTAEKSRLEKELEKLNKDLTLLQSRLGNTNFVQNAPAAVVAKDQEKLNELVAAQGKLKQKLDELIR